MELNKVQMIKKNILNKKIIFFGASERAKDFKNAFNSIEVAFYLDNDSSKSNTLHIDGKKIYQASILSSIDFKEYFIIITSSYYQEIENQLLEYGLKKNINFCSYIEYEHINLKPSNFFKDGHFYSTIPNIETINKYLNVVEDTETKELLGIEMNNDKQKQLFIKMQMYFEEFFDLYLKNKSKRYFEENNYFGLMDAATLFSYIRMCKPKKIIEIGSGFSSAVMLDTSDEYNLDIEFVFIEPFPERLYTLLTEKDKKNNKIEISQKTVQEIDISVFETLEAGDILFVDSSHVSKLNSDVNFILFEVLPRLKEGVLIHFHDITYPFDYPKEWIKEGRYWNEAYLLRSFLQYNSKFKIHLWPNYIFNKKLIEDKYIGSKNKNYGGSLWIIKEL